MPIRHLTKRGSTMRTMLTVSVPVEIGNQTIKDGTLPKTIEQATEFMKPEAS